MITTAPSLGLVVGERKRYATKNPETGIIMSAEWFTLCTLTMITRKVVIAIGRAAVDSLRVPTEEDDPFSHLRLNDNFIREAEQHEMSAQERKQEAYARWEKRNRRPRRSKPFIPLLVLILVAGGLVWTQSFAADQSTSLWKSAGKEVAARTQAANDSPTPRAAASKTPLGFPPDVASGGNYAFVATQPGETDPVAYDPCRPIQVVVQNRTAPIGGDAIIAGAIAEISRATGLQFELEGFTDEIPSEERDAFQPDRYSDRWAPVLIAWSDPSELPKLKGETAGFGGSSLYSISGSQPDVYVSGVVALDGPEISDVLSERDGEAIAQALVMHELGHLVGLDHVNDPTQIMNPVGNGDVTDLQSGDRFGLAALGRGKCISKL